MKNIKGLNRITIEPKVFSLMIIFDHGQFLYMGVHFSLEEAYAEALKKMKDIPMYKGDHADLMLWNSMEARDVVSDITEPTKKGVIAAKNILNSMHNNILADAKDDKWDDRDTGTTDMIKIPDVLRDIIDHPAPLLSAPRVKSAPTGALKEYYDWKKKNPFRESEEFFDRKKKKKP